MTEKQEKILQAALQLFGEEGYHATSTKKVATQAGVSEGLVFRHYENKEGLLQAVLAEGQKRAQELFFAVIMETEAKEAIRKMIELPFSMQVSEQKFWKLQFKLKWEVEVSPDRKMEPLLLSLANAFRKLMYAEPELEAEYLLHCVEGISGAILKGTLQNKERMQRFLLEKYNV
ncbi:MAG: helix-turn-helix domain-containing protein [Spirochaetota bacterium]